MMRPIAYIVNCDQLGSDHLFCKIKGCFIPIYVGTTPSINIYRHITMTHVHYRHSDGMACFIH